MKKLLFFLLAVLTGVALYIYLDPALNRQVQREFEDLKNASGQWQITDQPPAAGIAYETVQYDRNTNVVPSANLTGQKK
jgi:hypothetical protein